MSQKRRSFKTREQLTSERALEEARKAGTAPAELDEQGREINPHIPQYIQEVPWYVDASQAPSLKHQRLRRKSVTSRSEDFEREAERARQRGARRKRSASNRNPNPNQSSGGGRHGGSSSCSNCGASSHRTRDCCERPRKIGAKWSRSNVMDDEVIVNAGENDASESYDVRRDRWRGYSPSEYVKVKERFAKLEAERRARLEAELEAKVARGEPGGAAREGNEEQANGKSEAAALLAKDDSDQLVKDELKDERSMQVQSFDASTRTSVRNLRIREDTAKFLLNLDENSAFYDPKSRSMRANPLPDADPNEVTYAGDNALLRGGDVESLNAVQRFAWEATQSGADINVHALPTQGEALYRDFQRKKEELKAKRQQQLEARYGAGDSAPPQHQPVVGAHSEHYREYLPDGSEAPATATTTPSPSPSSSSSSSSSSSLVAAKSKWPEDVLIGNHTEIWGSYFVNGKWGYACCHQCIKNSYCTGLQGIKAARAADEHAQGELAKLDAAAAELARKEERRRRRREHKERKARRQRRHRGGSNDDNDELVEHRSKRHRT
jgi:pre-mRNA-processing factor SLU7